MKSIFSSLIVTILFAGAIFFYLKPNSYSSGTSSPQSTDSKILKPIKNMSDLSENELKEQLTDTQYYVAKQNGTEPPFRNEYWDNKKEGIYVDIISGKPLFSSKDKFDSGTGWPSFTQAIDKEEIIEVKDISHGMVRTEVRGKTGDSHLGHLFPDGPAPTGLRYCINSASLRFIPAEQLEELGYSQLAEKFQK